MKEYAAFPYSPARAAYAAKALADYGIIGDGSNRTVGDFDLSRVQRVLDIVRPVFAAQRQPLPDTLTPGDLVTNAYVDPTVSAR